MLFKPKNNIKDFLDFRNNGKELVVFSDNPIIEKASLFFTRTWYKFVTAPLTDLKYKFQEVTRGYSDLDKWNIKTYCARKMVPVLKSIRNDFMGTPLRLHEVNRLGDIVELDVEKIDRFSDESHFTDEEWRGVLDQMIFSFEFELEQDDPEFDIKYKVYPEGYQILKDTFWKEHEDKEHGKLYSIESKSGTKPDYTELRKAYKKQRDGLRLFAIYYPNLWD